MGRHGRKNRPALRVWQGKRDPDVKSVFRDPVGLCDENGRPLRFKIYADRHLLVLTGGDQHDPVLEWMHYDELAERNYRKDWISNSMSRRFGREPDLEQRCWYTGVLLYLVPYRLRDELGWKVPWECSREHLVCQRNGGYDNGLSNIVIAGRFLNKKVGHSPLPLKLLHRQEFAKKDFARDRPTWDAVRPWIEALIELEDHYKLGSCYPWQPWAFEPGTRERRIADAFHEEMLAEEREFLSLDDEGRADWVRNFTWRW